jgi:hypothetical protein
VFFSIHIGSFRRSTICFSYRSFSLLFQGFFILPSFQGLHQISEIKFSSPAHQCGKIEEGDEVVQVNYQTVVSGSHSLWLYQLIVQYSVEVTIFLQRCGSAEEGRALGYLHMHISITCKSSQQNRHLKCWSPPPRILTWPLNQEDFNVSVSAIHNGILNYHNSCNF